MTTPAKAVVRENDFLERTMDLYRDLSLALRKAIVDLQAEAATGEASRGHQDLIRSHQKCLQTVLDCEASLGKRIGTGGGGGGYDLDAARAEIRARLAQWSAGR